jgi:hypothetical protein
VATSGDFADSAWKRVARAACFFAQCRVAAGKLSLSPARVVVLHAYTLHAPAAALVNAALRAGDEHEWTPFAAHFWAALSRLPVRRAVLYRAVRLPREQLYALLEDYSRGATVLWDHFASMTTDPQRAAPWLYAAAAPADDRRSPTAVIRVRSTSARCVGRVLVAPGARRARAAGQRGADGQGHHELARRPGAAAHAAGERGRRSPRRAAMVRGVAHAQRLWHWRDGACTRRHQPARTVRDILKGETLLFDLDEQATL